MHAGLVAVIVAILLMASGIPKSSIVVEKKGLRPDRSRPGDVVVLDFYCMAQADTWSLMQ